MRGNRFGRHPGDVGGGVFNLCLLYCLAAFSSLVLTSNAQDWKTTAQSVLPSTVRIYAQNAKTGKTAHSTGVVIDERGIILTTAHGVENYTAVIVLFGDNLNTVQMEATVAKSSKACDLALLRIEPPVDTSMMKPVKVFKGLIPQMGTPVAVIGNPLQAMRSMTVGVVSAAVDYNGSEFLLLDAKVAQGNSGGPVVNEQGELLGIITDKVWEDGPALGRAPFITEIRRFMDQEKEGFLGLTTEKVKTGLSGYGLSEGLKITKVSTESAFKVGDIVMTLKDYPLFSHDDLVRIVRREAPGNEVQASILRNGEFSIIKVKILESPY